MATTTGIAKNQSWLLLKCQPARATAPPTPRQHSRRSPLLMGVLPAIPLVLACEVFVASLVVSCEPCHEPLGVWEA